MITLALLALQKFFWGLDFRKTLRKGASMAKKVAAIVVLCLPLFLFEGCAVSTQITNTSRSSIEEELLMRALDRALTGLNTEQLKGKAVAVDFYGLSPDKDFAKAFFTAWLQSQQVQMAPDPKEAQLRLKVFAPVLAVDQGQSFIGAPSFTVPLLGFAMPEISLFKDVRHSGHAELQVYSIDADTGKFIDKSPPAVGASQYDDYTILFVINFTRSDINSPTWEWQPGAG